jgi:hypothetical protein
MSALAERWRQWREGAGELLGQGLMPRLIVAAVALLLLLALVLGLLWSSEPGMFDVRAEAEVAAAGAAQPAGFTTTTTLIHVSTTLLDKPGGFLSNDILPPGVWLDNMPAWEYGVILQVRDLTRALRESISRSQSQSEEDDDLARAEPRFNFSTNSWAVPASESEYRDAIRYVQRYRARLGTEGKGGAHFYTRADNLHQWLGSVSARLGSLSQRLSASVGQRRIDLDARGDGSGSADLAVKTPWRKIDDVFYEARGTSWALLHFLRAIEIDFAEVLKNKNAAVSLRQIIRELEETQQPLYSPLILNGSGFGMLANHSLVMANYISRANAAIIDLRALLTQG